MTILALLSLSVATVSLPVIPADTPPRLPIEVSQLAQLKTMQDIIGVTLMADGSPAPSDITLPDLTNRLQALQYMRVHYPESMLKVTANSVPVAWTFVNEKGKVSDVKLITTSGFDELDSLALAVVKLALFKPARHKGKSIGVWIPFPARVPPHAELLATLKASGDVTAEAPTEVTYTQKPVLLNRNQVEAAIIRIVHSVSPQVREVQEAFARSQRVGGTAMMQIYIDTVGVVQNAVLKKTSGHRDLDAAAHNIAKMMRFSPAKNGEKPVDVWIEMPIQFKAN